MASLVSSLKGGKVLVDVESAARKSTAPDDVAARFEVQQLLGEGGMGSVFVAQDRGLGRVVALKRLREGLEKDQDSMRRFILEAQIGAQLEHPNIVPLYSFEHSEGGAPAITMQLLEGTSMATYIHNAADAPKEARAVRGEFALKERIGLLLGVCEAIHFAHERGVIHRDLKPDNVMLGRYREVYVMDWGLARVTGSPVDMARERRGNGALPTSLPDHEERNEVGTLPTIQLGTLDTIASVEGVKLGSSPSTATRQGEVMGTPQYMPPEQALGLIDKIGPAADQYALGVMLQELVTLRPARSHTSAMAALGQAVQNHLEPPVDVEGQLMHPALRAIVAKATEKDPAHRYPSVKAMTDDVRSFVRDEPVSVFDEGTARRLVRIAARRPVLAMAIFSSLGFLGTVVIVGSLVRNAQQAARHEREMENTRRAVGAVSARAHAIDVELSDLSAGVEAIGAAAVELLDRNPKDFDHSPRPLPHLTPDERYGGAGVNFEQTVIIWPGKLPDQELPDAAAKLTHLERWLRACVVDGLPAEDRRGDVAAQNAALSSGRGELLRAFVGLEDGTFTQYPAREVVADPRKRPWYRAAVREPELHWMRPAVDATKRTLRISAVMGLSAHGAFVGVAGCDLRVASLAKKLQVDVPGFQRAYLATEDAKIAVSPTLEASVLGGVKNQDDDLNLPPVENRELAAKIVAAERGGYVDTGDRLLVFSRLISTRWTYVTELDRARYIE